MLELQSDKRDLFPDLLLLYSSYDNPTTVSFSDTSTREFRSSYSPLSFKDNYPLNLSMTRSSIVTP